MDIQEILIKQKIRLLIKKLRNKNILRSFKFGSKQRNYKLRE